MGRKRATSRLVARKIPDPDGSEPPSTDAGDGIVSEPEVLLGDAVDTILVGATDGELTDVALPAERTKRVRYWREVF